MLQLESLADSRKYVKINRIHIDDFFKPPKINISGHIQASSPCVCVFSAAISDIKVNLKIPLLTKLLFLPLQVFPSLILYLVKTELIRRFKAKRASQRLYLTFYANRIVIISLIIITPLYFYAAFCAND